MKLLSFLLLLCLWAFVAAAQQSIEIKPGQMTFKGQGAELNDRLTSDANGMANFKTKQELVVVRNFFSQGGAQTFSSGVVTKMNFDQIFLEKKNNTSSNFNTTDDTILAEESGLYLFDLTMSWTSVFAGDLALRVSTHTTNSVYYGLVKRTADDPERQQFMGIIRLTAGDRISWEMTQTNSTGASKNATFAVSIAKL